jgi:predicted O-methyltransferase YrrM
MRYTQPDDNPRDIPWITAKYFKKHFPGLLYCREVRYLYLAASRVGGGNFADLGTFQGLGAAAMAQGLLESKEPGHVYSFDTFEATSISRKFRPKDSSLASVKERLRYYNVGDKVTLIQGRFSDSIQFVRDNNLTFRFMFIDGSHDYDSVLEDFLTWSPYLERGGELAFHDSLPHMGDNKEVWKLMNEMEAGLRGDWEKVAVERSLTSWRKR